MTLHSQSTDSSWQDLPLARLCREYPQVSGFLSGYLIDASRSEQTLYQVLYQLEDDHFRNNFV